MSVVGVIFEELFSSFFSHSGICSFFCIFICIFLGSLDVSCLFSFVATLSPQRLDVRLSPVLSLSVDRAFEVYFHRSQISKFSILLPCVSPTFFSP